MPSARRPGQDVDLFAAQEQAAAVASAPLAARMRPRTLADYAGQEHLVGAGRLVQTLLARGALPSLVLWGPPGSGKTTLAQLIAGAVDAHFEPLSAVTAGVADLRRVVQEARDRQRHAGRRTILFVDEIHRFNKAQQDVILPHVENGTVILIGATTENPSFEVVAPLLSRCRVLVLRALTEDQLAALARRALADRERGLGGLGLTIDDDALAMLAAAAGGDARTALNTLEIAATLADPTVGRITAAEAREAMQHRSPRYDKGGESHFDTISAFIKSIRASDPDAAVYYLARMLTAGEDPLFIARRLVILASEDVGMADSRGLLVAVAAQQAAAFVGMPEAYYPLTHATLYLASAPKSNSAGTTYAAAREAAERTASEPPPLHLRNAVTGLLKGLGYGAGYQYAHDQNQTWVPADAEEAGAPPPFLLGDNLPEAARGGRFYQPSGFGEEDRVRRWLERRERARTTGDPSRPPEQPL